MRPIELSDPAMDEHLLGLLVQYFVKPSGVVVILLLGIMASLPLWSGYHVGEMDWDGNDTVSISEYFDATDMRHRDIVHDGKRMREYYQLKDGMSVRFVLLP